MSLALRMSLIIMLAGWAFVFASLIGFDPADPPSHLVSPANSPVANWCGLFGAYVSYLLIKLLGFGAWVVVSFLGLGLLAAAAGALPRHAPVRVLGLLLLTAAISCAQHVLVPTSGPMPDLAGGLVGTVAGNELVLRFGTVGAVFPIFLGGLLGALVAMDEWLLAAFSWSWDKTREHGVPAAKVAGSAAGEVALAAGSAAARVGARAGESLFSTLMEKLRPAKKRRARLNDVDDDKPSATEPGRKAKARAAVLTGADFQPAEAEQEDVSQSQIEAKPAKRRKAASDEAEIEPDSDDEDKVPIRRQKADAAVPAPDASDDGEEDEEDNATDAPQVYDQEALKAKIAKLPVYFGQKDKTTATDADLKDYQVIAEGENYRFPGMDLLEEPEANFNERLEQYVRSQAESLEAALKQYRIDGSVVGIESGPVVTLFDLKLAPGTKVAALQAISSDIARALKAINIRIVPNQAGRDTVGIEVPNEVKEKVRLKELMAKTEKFSNMKLPMFLGKDASGEPLIEDLTKMPHMLIAGTTGSGKSVCMNTIIMGFLYTKKPSELKLVLVDPKMVEMSQFKDIPHLMCPVVTEMGKAAAILEWACGKMDERYELLAEAGCRDIASYNELTWEELKERLGVTDEESIKVPRKLPYMVFIIDELADLMMTNKEVEGSIIRIAQKARAVGIHLILATQRPQANVVTGLIKSNMPCRIAFKVASGMDSRIVLDQKGGELLLGQGDMLLLSPRSSKLSRSQGTLVDDREIRSVVKFMREVASPSFERTLVQMRANGSTDDQRIADSQNNSSASLQAAQEDPMFNRAVEIVLETKRGSVSLLQRRLAIGYTRASRLIDLMGIAGIISDHKGSVARDVRISPQDWEMMKRLAAEEAQAKGIVLPTEEGGTPVQSELFAAEEKPAAKSKPVGLVSESDQPTSDEIDSAFDEGQDEEEAPFADEDDEDTGKKMRRSA